MKIFSTSFANINWISHFVSFFIFLLWMSRCSIVFSSLTSIVLCFSKNKNRDLTNDKNYLQKKTHDNLRKERTQLYQIYDYMQVLCWYSSNIYPIINARDMNQSKRKCVTLWLNRENIGVLLQLANMTKQIVKFSFFFMYN